MLAQNVQSIKNKVEHLRLILASLKCDVLCLTEHWLTDKDDADTILNLNAYSVASSYSRKQFSHEGVMILNNKWKYRELVEIKELSLDRDVEMAAVEVQAKQTVIICIYRSPVGNTRNFMDTVEMALGIINASNYKSIFIAGDFNINSNQDSKERRGLMDLFSSFGLNISTYKPTRITAVSATCIDNIFTNVSQELLRV